MTMVDATLHASNESVSNDSDSTVVDPQGAIDSVHVDEVPVSLYTTAQRDSIIDVDVECNSKATSASRKLLRKFKPVEYLRECRKAVELQKLCMDHPSLFRRKYKELDP